MKASTNTQVSHESETQRQHVRFSMPARVLLNGKEYPVRNISAGGISLAQAENIVRGRQVSLELGLPFEGFGFSMRLDAEALYYNAQDKTLGLRFINLKPEQISFLNHVIKAFMSGEVVTSGNILNVAGRNNFTKPRTHANVNAAAPSLRRQLPGLLVVAAIGCLITTFIVGNLYNSLFIVRSEDAAVAGPVVSLKAPDAGVYRSRLDQGVTLAQKGQVIGTITPGNGGAAVAVQSPCNCYIASSVDNGEAVTEGQQVVSMTPIESKPWILAEVDPAQAKKIGPETVATATVFGSEIEYTGKVISMESALSNPARAGNRSVLMKIALDQKLPVNFVNRLAAVTFAIH